MQLKTNYEAMSNQELLAEFDTREEIMNYSLGGYQTAFQYSMYQNKIVFLICIHDDTINVSSTTEMNDSIEIYTNDPEWRQCLIGILQSPFFIVNLDSKIEAYTQEAYIKKQEDEDES